MKALAWLVYTAFFLLALWFSLKNMTPVQIHLTEALHWDNVPLILVMLVALAAGALLGFAAAAPTVFRLRRDLARAAGAVGARPATAPPRPTESAAPGTLSGPERLAAAAREAGAGAEFGTDLRRPR